MPLVPAFSLSRSETLLFLRCRCRGVASRLFRQERVAGNGGGQGRFRARALAGGAANGADDVPLAQDSAVELAGDLFRHLEDQFHVRIVAQHFAGAEEDAGLTDVLDSANMPLLAARLAVLQG